MDAKLINKLISNASKNRTDMSAIMDITAADIAAAKITIEVPGQETIVFECASEFAVFALLPEKKVVSLTGGSIGFMDLVSKTLAEHVGKYVIGQLKEKLKGNSRL
jgi:hypothetical protein